MSQPARFPRLTRCTACNGTGTEPGTRVVFVDHHGGLDEDGERCGACQGTGGADCFVCHEPSPEVSSLGICERCCSDEGLAVYIDAECPAVADPRLPSPVEAYQDVVRLRLAWAARREWQAYRYAQAEAAREAAEVAAERRTAAEPFNLPF